MAEQANSPMMLMSVFSPSCIRLKRQPEILLQTLLFCKERSLLRGGALFGPDPFCTCSSWGPKKKMRVSPGPLVSFSKSVGYCSEPVPAALSVFGNFLGGFRAISTGARGLQVAMLAGEKL